MGQLAILALRAVLVCALAGSLFLQAVMLPQLASDLSGFDPAIAAVRLPVIVILVLGVVTTQVVMVCIWRLLTMVRAGTVFSSAAFGYVDVVIAAVTAASLLTFALGFVLAPGDPVSPGVIVLIGGAAVVIAGIALVVVVMRALLAQAVTRDTEAHHLQAELDAVI